MKKLKSSLLTLGLVGILALSSELAGCGQNQQDNNLLQDSSGVAGSTENSEQDEAVEIGSRDDFAKIYDDLSASYILTADIDFGGEAVNPVGIFEPKSDAEEDAETPNTAMAFTGTFDGNGHTLSNIKIDAADKNGVGLFGCMTGEGSWVKNLKVENISVKGGNYTGGVIGFADFGSYVEGFYSPMFKEYYPEPAKSDISACTVSEFTVSGGKYVGAAVGYSYGTTSVDGFDGQMTWDGSESKEQIGADESVKLEELK
ncbi:hypothetical protein AALB53_23605 [Lachnospiraceae bacterium 47-T17]